MSYNMTIERPLKRAIPGQKILVHEKYVYVVTKVEWDNKELEWAYYFYDSEQRKECIVYKEDFERVEEMAMPINRKSRFRKVFDRLFPRLESATQTSRIITLRYTDGSIKHYKGNSTVWHKYPMMHRCNSSIESKLCEISQYINQWGNPWPTAHLRTAQKDISYSRGEIEAAIYYGLTVDRDQPSQDIINGINSYIDMLNNAKTK